MLNAYKYRLHPTREQSGFFNKSFGCVRFIYNWGLQKRIEAYAKDKGRISYVQLCAMLTELKKRRTVLVVERCKQRVSSTSVEESRCGFHKVFQGKERVPEVQVEE